MKSTLDTLKDSPLELGGGSAFLETSWLHWRVALDEEGIFWAILDQKDRSTNTLSQDVLEEFDHVLSFSRSKSPRGFVLRSGKKNGFVAGAEISDFQKIKEIQELSSRIEDGLALFDRFAALPFPTLALLHGFCLGGGLELALAARYRLARGDASFGFPEVKLGLHPGLGGVFRGLQTGDPLGILELMLSGKTIKSKAALSMGLVDGLFEERLAQEAVRQCIGGRYTPSLSLPKRLKRLVMRGVLGFSPSRKAIVRRIERALEKKVSRLHYPAPFVLLKLFEACGLSQSALRAAETKGFVECFFTSSSRNLVRCFFLREHLKSSTKGKELTVSHVHVVGAGVMGGDIAAWAALKGMKVTLQDQSLSQIAPAIGRAHGLFSKVLKTPPSIQAAHDRLRPDPEGAGLRHADLIIEAVFEREDVKHAVLKNCEDHMKSGAILATNTSSLPLDLLKKELQNPARFCGLHFFNPVSQMPLVEFIPHDGMDHDVQTSALAFLGALDKLPLVVRSMPGFFINRVLMSYLLEAFSLREKGVAPEVIDQAAEAFGMPMGPMELADVVGLDVSAHVARSVQSALGEERCAPLSEDTFNALIEKGKLGKKTGEGIYVWKGGKPVKRPPSQCPSPPHDLEDRLVLSLLNETVDCLADGIVADRDSADAGMIFGAGFAPFLGGPLHYAQIRGIEGILEDLEALKSHHGPRFQPSTGWQALLGKTQLD